MNVKSKFYSVLGSLTNHLPAMSKDTNSGRRILSDIEDAISRSSDRSDHLPDDRFVNEILFLVSNAPGSITFLARRLSARLETTHDRMVALKTLVLIHRLLRGGDRFFEQDLRLLWSSGDLRIIPQRLGSPFVISYSLFLQERIEWIINQAGKLEPVPQDIELHGYEDRAIKMVLYKVSRCQELLDRVMPCLPDKSRDLQQSQVSMFVISIIVKESFRVYDSFCEGFEIVFASFFNLKRPAIFSALEILRKASIQTPKLQEFYDSCKRIITLKNTEYPSLRIITEADFSSMEHFAKAAAADDHDLMKRNAEKGKHEEQESTTEQACEADWWKPFSKKLETKITTVWVEFDEGESKISSKADTLKEGESSESSKTMVLL